MPMLKRHVDSDDRTATATPASYTARPGEVATMSRGAVFVESPARLLHEQLASHFENGVAIADSRWPGVARVGVIVGASIALWGIIGFAIIQSV